LLLFLVGALLLAAAAMRIKPINALRTKYDLETTNPYADREISAQLRIPTVALFTFRSLAIDYLWIRADNLKQEGQFFDALHLSRMICALQPNLASVWDFQAWNMAYNISVEMPTPPERWEWVRAGFELLRDQGLVYNPRSLKLYRQLGWIFQHKVGGITDDYHRYYKLRMAFDIMPLLTPFYNPLLGPGSKGTNEDLEAMVQVTTDWNQLRREEPVAALVEKIKKAEPKFTSDRKMFDGLLDIRVSPTDYAPALHQVIEDNLENKSLHKLDYFIRCRALREKWKMDPEFMLKINKQYGPVDYDDENRHLSLEWRSPFCHAIYWAMKGLRFAGDRRNFDTLNLNRIVYHSLQNLYHKGNIEILTFVPPPRATLDEKGQEVFDAPEQLELNIFSSQNLRMFPISYQATRDLIKSYTDAGQAEPKSVVDGSVNLARSGIQNLYLAGHKNMAQRYLNHLRKFYPGNKDYQVALDVFVRQRMKEEIEQITPKNASNYIISLLRDGYYNLAIGNDEKAAVREAWARQIIEILKIDYPDEEDRIQRLTLLPFEQMRWLALKNFMTDQFVNPNVKSYLMSRLQTSNPQLYDKVMEEINKLRDTGSAAPNETSQK